MGILHVTFILFQLFALNHSAPTAYNLQTPLKPPQDRCGIYKYTTTWFLQNVKPEFANSSGILNNALFYSRGMSTVARRYARDQSMITLWDVWPCYLYNHHQTSDNPLACIHNNKKHRLLFYENMSRAFAIKARNFSTVMHSFGDYPDPPKDGIWGRIELPVLTGRGFVDEMEKINEDNSSSQIFWRRGMTRHVRREEVAYLNFEYMTCMSEEDYKFFDDINW